MLCIYPYHLLKLNWKFVSTPFSHFVLYLSWKLSYFILFLLPQELHFSPSLEGPVSWTRGIGEWVGRGWRYVYRGAGTVFLDASVESLAPVQYLLGLWWEFSSGAATSLCIPGTQAHMQFLQGNLLCHHRGKSQDESPGLEYRDQASFKSMIYIFRQDRRSVVLGPVTILWWPFCGFSSLNSSMLPDFPLDMYPTICKFQLLTQSLSVSKTSSGHISDQEQWILLGVTS